MYPVHIIWKMKGLHDIYRVSAERFSMFDAGVDVHVRCNAAHNQPTKIQLKSSRRGRGFREDKQIYLPVAAARGPHHVQRRYSDEGDAEQRRRSDSDSDEAAAEFASMLSESRDRWGHGRIVTEASWTRCSRAKRVAGSENDGELRIDHFALSKTDAIQSTETRNKNKKQKNPRLLCRFSSAFLIRWYVY
eukprot:CAMPEP_0196667064 /NCGR_PEP_ID=MMETSP1086-20130531/64876_1 /TAXON_ID=77921 /ORGANISM="Cyanoptyche  gloeocystis , Strain SAG4.97" /LENGTH=189 /DNA_ID=CAMNT_0042004353 /DNA_START=349 /DNA_END=918 /DNA_ORIENTATION=-